MSLQNNNQFSLKCYLFVFLLMSFRFIAINSSKDLYLTLGKFLGGIYVGLKAKDIHTEHEAY
jgi:hypothetical protein